MSWLRENRVFLGQFFRRYHTTGSVLPSSRALARALCRFVDPGAGARAGALENGQTDAPRQILEVGPGTGAVTAQLVRKLRPKDHLTLVELNDDFVRHLNHRFESEPDFQAVAARSQILHCRLEDLPGEHSYHLIISGLPLNNFEIAEVEGILDVFRRLQAPGGTLSFFQYIAIRRAKAVVSSSKGRARLQGIGQALDRILNHQEIHRDWVWPNLPPAWVHHVRFDDSRSKQLESAGNR